MGTAVRRMGTHPLLPSMQKPLGIWEEPSMTVNDSLAVILWSVLQRIGITPKKMRVRAPG